MKYSSLTLFLLLSSLNVSAAMRCGTVIVDVGDHKIDVLKKCGEPMLTERRTRIVGQELHHPGWTLDINQYEEIIIDEWTYNFGPYKLMQYLRFENGILKEIDDLGYGYSQTR